MSINKTAFVNRPMLRPAREEGFQLQLACQQQPTSRYMHLSSYCTCTLISLHVVRP